MLEDIAKSTISLQNILLQNSKIKYRLAREDNLHVHQQLPASDKINSPTGEANFPAGARYQNTEPELQKFKESTISLNK